MTKEESSTLYIKGKLRDSNEYRGCDEHRRMTLIQRDLYGVQQAFEDGWEEAVRQAIEWLTLNMADTVYMGCHGRSTLNKADFIDNLKKAIE